MGVGAFGLAVASAASLGGLTTNTLGAENGVVASCDTDGVTLAYTNTYDATSGLYRVSSVTVSGIASPACTGKTLTVTLRDAGNASLGTGSAAVGGTSQAVTITPNANSNLVVGAAIVIQG
jgi:hypothetical protein